MLQGLYIVSGTNHLEFANFQNVNIVPSNAPVVQEPSLYWTLPPKFLSEVSFLMGPPANYNSGNIPARERFIGPLSKTVCNVREDVWVHVNTPTAVNARLFQVFPNPAVNSFTIDSQQPGYLEIFDILGRKTWDARIPVGQQTIFCHNWPYGYYLATLRHKDGISQQWLFKVSSN
ncbi:MAG TPA: hypothetical protein DCF33_09015 [Saprospirales bacterium]|nr:hypothetical protein [Saprospirales bacterium]